MLPVGLAAQSAWSEALITCRWQQLTTLTAYSNALTGSLPKSWGSGGGFQNLRTLVLSSNPIAGTLPASWGTGFPKIKDLNLDNLQLSGSLPDLDLKELEQLNVRLMLLPADAGLTPHQQHAAERSDVHAAEHGCWYLQGCQAHASKCTRLATDAWAGVCR